MGIQGNETADEAAKEALDEEIQQYEKYLPEDLKWMKNKHQEKCERSTSTMKECKPFSEKNTNTKTMNRREQVVVRRPC
jgi:hypothetical protein